MYVQNVGEFNTVHRQRRQVAVRTWRARTSYIGEKPASVVIASCKIETNKSAGKDVKCVFALGGGGRSLLLEVVVVEGEVTCSALVAFCQCSSTCCFALGRIFQRIELFRFEKKERLGFDGRDHCYFQEYA